MMAASGSAAGAASQRDRRAARGADGQLCGVGRHRAAADVAIVDWREVPTWTEFEILRDAFIAAGVPTIVCDPASWCIANGTLTAQGSKIDLVYRRVLVNDILAKPLECRALVDACADRAVCMANTFRCKLAHKKAFFALLTDPRERVSLLAGGARRDSRARAVDAGARRRGDAEGRLARRPAGARQRAWREHLVLKPNDEYGGNGVTSAGRRPRASGSSRSRRRSTIRTARGSCRSAFRCGVRSFPSSTRWDASA